MQTYPVEFYDLVTRALGGNSKEYIQGFLDDVMAQKYNTLQTDGFAFAPEMQLDFTFKQLTKEVGLNAVANYYDLDSPAIPFGTEGVQEITGSIPRMKAVEYFNEDKFRKMAIAEDRISMRDRVAENAKMALFNTLDTLIGGHTNALTYQRHQIVSKSQFVLTDTNNPYGLRGVTFSAKVPTANINALSGTKRWWTSVTNGVYSNEGADCDPIADMQKVVLEARRKGVRGHFEVETSYMDQILGHSKVKAALAAKFFPAIASAAAAVAVLGREQKINGLAEILGAPIKLIDSIVSIEKYNTTSKKLERTNVNAFEDNVLVFVPDGSLGEILCVEPIKLNGGNYGEFYGGRLLLTVGVDYVKKCQSYNTEMTALVVPDKPQLMWYIRPYANA